MVLHLVTQRRTESVSQKLTWDMMNQHSDSFSSLWEIQTLDYMARSRTRSHFLLCAAKLCAFKKRIIIFPCKTDITMGYHSCPCVLSNIENFLELNVNNFKLVQAMRYERLYVKSSAEALF